MNIEGKIMIIELGKITSGLRRWSLNSNTRMKQMNILCRVHKAYRKKKDSDILYFLYNRFIYKFGKCNFNETFYFSITTKTDAI